MESWRTRQRLANNYVVKKYGHGHARSVLSELSAGRVDGVKAASALRKPGDVSDLFVESDPKEGASASASFMAKYDIVDLQELLVSSQTHWLLSDKELQSKVAVQHPPSGLMGALARDKVNPDRAVVLWPVDDKMPAIELAAVHQLIRELTLGIYLMNQIPFLLLKNNYDQSTSCHLPPAYQDTYLGQLLIAIDFLMKGLWHGMYFPLERRLTFNRDWKTRLRVKEDGVAHCKLPVLYEFQSVGLYDITKEVEFQSIYDSVPKKLLKPLKPPGDFLADMEDVTVMLTFFQKSVKRTDGIYLLDSDFFAVGSSCSYADELTNVDHLSQYLHSMGQIVKNSLGRKPEAKLKLALLKLTSLLIPAFISMKQQLKIPQLSALMPPFQRAELKTERTLPPITVGPNFKNSAFHQENRFMHLHGGIQFAIETPDPEPCPSNFVDIVREQISKYDPEDQQFHINKYEQKEGDEKLVVPTVTIGKNNYFVVQIWLENYLPGKYPRPLWLQSLGAEMARAKFLHLPMINCQVQELFEKYCGSEIKQKVKDLEWTLHEAARLGLVSVVHAIVRLIPMTRLEKQNKEGLSVTHVAALNNHVHVLGQLAFSGFNMNTRKHMYQEPSGLTPLHLAARVGALMSVSFLLAVGADVAARDQNGYAAIHHAAGNNQLPVVKLLVSKYGQIELETGNSLQLTPLLLAAQRGALDTMISLLDMGAQRGRTDSIGRNCIVLAALEYRYHILDYFIQQQYEDMLAWTTLVEMLRSNQPSWRYGSCKTVEILSANPDHLHPILHSGIPPLLVDVLNEEDDNLQKSALVSLCNICRDEDVQVAITSAKPVPVLVQRLQSPNERICTLATEVTRFIANIGDNKTLFGIEGALQSLKVLLLSKKEEVLLEVTGAIFVLCFNHLENQQFATEHEIVASFVHLLMRPDISDDALLILCETCSLLIEQNPRSQLVMVQANGIEALSHLLHSQNVHIQIRAAKILGVLASSHRKMINEDVMKPMIAMLKVYDIEVRIQGASALWALAGSTMALQKFTATSIGVKLLTNMLLTKNDELIFYACRFIAAFGLEDMNNQNVFLSEGGVETLVRFVLSCDEQENVMFEIMRTLGILCVGVAHSNNWAVQKQVGRHDSMRCMTAFVNDEEHKYGEELRVEVLYTLACVVLNNEENLKLLGHHGGFNYPAIIQLMHSERESVRIKAGQALSTYAFNKRQFQNELQKAGKIEMSFFESFLESKTVVYKCQAAFQMAVLAHLVKERDPILITARGLSYLTSKLEDNNEDTFTIAASLISSLARSRTGIPDGLITLLVVELLISKLKSDNSQVRTICAVALGYLSFNFKASRRLLTACRADPELFENLMCSLQANSKIADSFIEAVITMQIAKKQAIFRMMTACPHIASIIKSRHLRR